jgi:hypothetical protein
MPLGLQYGMLYDSHTHGEEEGIVMKFSRKTPPQQTSTQKERR